MRITVVVPTFNSMKYVDQCLDSVLAQTYDDMEVIVYENESTDGTYEHLKSREDEGENFELISIPNVYANSFLEAVLDVTKNSKSEDVTFICSDDYVDKNYILKNMDILEKNKKGISLQSGLIWVNENGEIIPIDFGIMGRLDKLNQKYFFVKYFLFVSSVFHIFSI